MKKNNNIPKLDGINRYYKLILFIFLCVIAIVICVSVPYNFISCLDDFAILSNSEFNLLKSKKMLFCSNVITATNDNDISDSDLQEYVINYKLFNLINIKSLKIQVVNNSKVVAGGNCLGFTLDCKGAILIGGNYVITKNGLQSPITNSDLKIGDIITKLDNTEILCVNDVLDYLKQTNNSKPIKVFALRGDEQIITHITPAFDLQTNTYKLGLWLKDDTMGVGTLTYINAETNRFGALGHAVTVNESQNPLEISGGSIYNCNVVGVKVGNSGSAGQLMGAFSIGDTSLGSIDKNNQYGVFGNVNNSKLIDGKSTIEIGGKLTAKPGKATILSTVDGRNINSFDVEIIKTNFQKARAEKSMVLRVVDEELLSKTGGIVQGMSGSPIIQDGKLIGAVTHVFLNDASKGFGLYIDWMLDN